MTGDQFIHDIVTGNVTGLESLSFQDKWPKPLVLKEADQSALDVAMQEFIDFTTVEKCNDLKTDQAFY